MCSCGIVLFEVHLHEYAIVTIEIQLDTIAKKLPHECGCYFIEDYLNDEIKSTSRLFT